MQVLRALLRRALGEDARNAPALADVVIESAAEPRLWVQFSNGYRTSAPLLPQDCFAFCERHAAWDIESLRLALLGEGRIVYARMLQERMLQDQDEMREGQGRTWVTEQMRRLGRGLAQTLRPRHDTLRFPVFGAGVAFLGHTATATSLSDGIVAAARRISDIVAAMRSYTYLDRGTWQTVDVTEGIESTVVLMRSKLGAMRVERRYAPDVPQIEVRGNELNQVWTNVIDNAVDATGGRGTLAIRNFAFELRDQLAHRLAGRGFVPARILDGLVPVALGLVDPDQVFERERRHVQRN